MSYGIVRVSDVDTMDYRIARANQGGGGVYFGLPDPARAPDDAPPVPVPIRAPELAGPIDELE